MGLATECGSTVDDIVEPLLHAHPSSPAGMEAAQSNELPLPLLVNGSVICIGLQGFNYSLGVTASPVDNRIEHENALF